MINPEQDDTSTTVLYMASDLHRGLLIHEFCAPGRTCGQCQEVRLSTTMHDLITRIADINDGIQMLLEELWAHAAND